MKIQLLVFLCFVSFSCSRSIPEEEPSEIIEIVNLIEPDYSVVSTDASFVELYDPLMNDAPLSPKALKRVKKSLNKRRMKRLTKPKYLEEKFRDMLEQRPALKSKIKNKLAIQKTRNPAEDVPEVNTITFNNGEKVQAPEQFVSPALPEAPVFAAPVYSEAPMFAAPMHPEAPVFAAPMHPEAPVFAAPMHPEFAVPALPVAPVFAAPMHPEAPVFAAPTLSGEPMYVPLPLPQAPVCEPIRTESVLVLQEPQFGSLEELTPCDEAHAFGRRSIDRDLLAMAANPAFEVHPISEDEIMADPCVQAEEGVTEFFDLSEKSQVSDCQVQPSSVRILESEPSTLFLTVEDSLEEETIRVALDDNQCSPKFRKEIPFGQTPEEIFLNALTMEPTYEFPAEFILESMPCAEHFWAPLEPVKTYEIKQINIDKEAIINEIKSVLGEDAGPIIIGEPGEPVIVRHYAKPYVVEYYERPLVVDHHQTAELNVFRSPPVVVDQFEPLVVNELQADPLIVVEEVCAPAPCVDTAAIVQVSATS